MQAVLSGEVAICVALWAYSADTTWRWSCSAAVGEDAVHMGEEASSPSAAANLSCDTQGQECAPGCGGGLPQFGSRRRNKPLAS